MANKTSSSIEGYDLSTTGELLNINCGSLVTLGWIVDGGSAADYVIEIQPEDDTTYYQIDSYSSVTDIEDGAFVPEAFRIRIRNTSTVNDTADAILGGADR
jgi:hypothetical protein